MVWFPAYVDQGGGYLLGKDASSIAVGEVISAVDESVDATRCQGKGGCRGGDKCLTHALWRDLSDRLTGFLNNITLGELVNNQGSAGCVWSSAYSRRATHPHTRRDRR